MVKKTGDWYQYSGAMHMHTTESDGTLAIGEVIDIGRRAGLDFMMFTDHMTLSNRDDGHEGFYGDTLVVVGYEHNDLDDKHHYLLFDSPKVYPKEMSAKEYVAAGAADKAIGILAHPDEIRNAVKRYPPYPWLDWDADQFDGIELWNHLSEWMEKLTPYNKIPMAFSPRKSMVGPTERILKKWDEINMTRKCVGIAGVDAHAFPISVWPFTVEIFPYKVHFRCLRTHVLLPEPFSDDLTIAKKQLYDAFRDCRVFGSNMRWGSADSFEFNARSDGQRATMGGKVPLSNDTTIKVNLPSIATIKLIHNGQQVVEASGDRLSFTVREPGIYRVEAWKNHRCWIFSNHLRIGDSKQ